jgi:hypothetical protein
VSFYTNLPAALRACPDYLLLLLVSMLQLVLEARKDSSEPYKANYKLSITRIGSRAFPRALEVSLYLHMQQQG